MKYSLPAVLRTVFNIRLAICSRVRMAKAFVQSFLMMKHLHIKGSHVFSGILGIDHVLSENSAPQAPNLLVDYNFGGIPLGYHIFSYSDVALENPRWHSYRLEHHGLNGAPTPPNQPLVRKRDQKSHH